MTDIINNVNNPSIVDSILLSRIYECKSDKSLDKSIATCYTFAIEAWQVHFFHASIQNMQFLATHSVWGNGTKPGQLYERFIPYLLDLCRVLTCVTFDICLCTTATFVVCLYKGRT